MSQIILDFGSGNTCQNNTNIVKRMIDELAAVDNNKHQIIIKWQLFKQAGDNIPLDRRIFDYAYHYAKKYGYKTTASVFDLTSLNFLLEFDIPFIKIANNRALDWLIGEVPRKVPVYVSYDKFYDYYDKVDFEHEKETGITPLLCLSKYPSTIEDYQELVKYSFRTLGDCNISDHTIGLELFKKYQPAIWECHYKLDNSTGLDAGPFAKTPKALKEIL